jgi:hypothetical protein
MAKLQSMKARSLLSAFLIAGSLAACSAPQPGASSESSAQPTASPATADTALPVGTVTATATATVTAPPTAAPTATQSTEPNTKITAPYVLMFQQTGGIAGLRMETVIDTAAKKISYSGPRGQTAQSRDLTPEDIRGISRALEEANVETFRKLKGPPVADAFEYTITVRTGGKEYVASWHDGTTPPDAYQNVRTAVNKLREAKFSSSPTTGAPDR